MQSSHSAAGGTVFRRLVAVLAGVAFAAAVLFGLMDSVAAKGPESAIITGPGIGRPIELIDYTLGTAPDLLARLMEQTGIWYATGDLPRPIEEPAGELGPGYTLTWINSGPPDKGVDERTIRQEIYLDAEGGPLIYTPAQDSLQNWGPGRTGWFAAPSGLRDTLAGLGVPVSTTGSFGDMALSESIPGTTLPERQPAGTFWYPSLVGFLLVAALVVALGARRRRLRDSRVTRQ